LSAPGENLEVEPFKFGESFKMLIPSQDTVMCKV